MAINSRLTQEAAVTVTKQQPATRLTQEAGVMVTKQTPSTRVTQVALLAIVVITQVPYAYIDLVASA